MKIRAAAPYSGRVRQRPAFDISLGDCRLTRYDNHLERRLSSLRGQYSDSGAYQRLLEI